MLSSLPRFLLNGTTSERRCETEPPERTVSGRRRARRSCGSTQKERWWLSDIWILLCVFVYYLLVDSGQRCGAHRGYNRTVLWFVFWSDMETGIPFGWTLRCEVVMEAMGRLFWNFKNRLQLTASLWVRGENDDKIKIEKKPVFRVCNVCKEVWLLIRVIQWAHAKILLWQL